MRRGRFGSIWLVLLLGFPLTDALDAAWSPGWVASGDRRPKPASPAPASPGLLVLFPTAPHDGLVEPLRRRVRREAGAAAATPVELGDVLIGPMGADPGAWRQGTAFVRASLWFLMGRQALAARDDAAALTALRSVRNILYQGDLLVRPQLLASISLITGRVLLDGGDLAGASDAFRNAAVIDPDDLSDQLPEGPARIHYQSARQWAIEAPRLPVRIESSRPGALLTLNGARVQGPGPEWLVELPPGEHLAAATRDGARPDTAAFRLAPGDERPRIRLSVEPGSTCEPCVRPFSLGEASAFLTRATEVLTARGADHLVLEVVVRPIADKQPERPAPKVGVQAGAGVKVNPGPDAGDEPPPAGPVEVELFRIDRAGKITRAGGGEVGPGD